VCILIIFL